MPAIQVLINTGRRKSKLRMEAGRKRETESKIDREIGGKTERKRDRVTKIQRDRDRQT